MRTLVLLSMAALVVTTHAHATEPGEPVRIEFLDEPGCPDKAAFMTAVRARSARVREAEQGETARAFRVVLAVVADGSYHGELTVIDSDTEGAWGRSRSIDGKSCQEVVDALALFTVLAVDPTAVLGEQAEGSPAEEATAPPPPLPVVPAAPRAEEPPPDVPPAAKPVESETRFRATAGIHGGILALGTSAPLPGFGISSEIGLDDSGKVGIALTPSARISLIATGVGTVEVPEGSADLRWTKLGLDLCPLVFRGTKTLAARPCFSVSEGLLNATGHIAEPKSVTASFHTLGVLARVEWQLAGAWLFELTGGLEWPLRRDDFYFEPSTIVYRVPPLVGVVTLGGGYRFL